MHVEVVENVLKLNDDVARRNRAVLHEAGVFTIDLLGGPGCGKTTLVERTLAALRAELRIAVIVGDLATARDAQRIARHCPHVVQVNTGKGCHLEAHQVRQAMERIDLHQTDLLIIENVGNLVCPVGFDLGQDVKVGMFSTTEGADKPAKYPYMVHESDVVLLNKTDLLPYVPFDVNQFDTDVRRLRPDATVLRCSAYLNKLDSWLDWLRARAAAPAEISAPYTKANPR